MEIKFVLNSDGTEIDEEYFPLLENNSVLNILKEGEIWIDGMYTYMYVYSGSVVQVKQSSN